MQDKSYPDNFIMNLQFLLSHVLFVIHHICSQDFADADLKENKKYTSVVLIYEVKLIILGDVASQ